MTAAEFVKKAIEIWEDNGKPNLGGCWEKAHMEIVRMASDNGIDDYGFGDFWGKQKIYARVDGVYAEETM